MPAAPTPFENPGDYKVLVNDWPYGMEKGIVHLIVWIKHRLPATAEKGDLTEEGRRMVDGFVGSRFKERLGQENVLWFRNWTGLQSVRALEHVHVLVRGDRGSIEEVLR